MLDQILNVNNGIVGTFTTDYMKLLVSITFAREKGLFVLSNVHMVMVCAESPISTARG